MTTNVQEIFRISTPTLKKYSRRSLEMSKNSSGRFPRGRKTPRGTQEAFRGVGKRHAERRKLSEGSENAMRSAGGFPKGRKTPRGAREAFQRVEKRHAERGKLSEGSEGSMRSAGRFPRDRDLSIPENQPIATLIDHDRAVTLYGST